jgi:hypothetical protein
LHEFAGTVPTGSVAAALPFVAVTVTVGLHLWRRHMLLSFSVGTAAHVAAAVLIEGAAGQVPRCSATTGASTSGGTTWPCPSTTW